MVYIIAFYLEHYTYRGTGVVTYDYAYYNQTLLNNKSIIITTDPPKSPKDIEVVKKFSIFPTYTFKNNDELKEILIRERVDGVYILKYGKRDDINITCVPTFIHCVYCTDDPHGTVYAAVSDTIAEKYIDTLKIEETKKTLSLNDFFQKIYDIREEEKILGVFKEHNRKIPAVNHMIRPMVEDNKNFRKQLNIPDSAIVFGRHGGADTFSIPFVRDVIIKILETRSDIYFLFCVKPIIFNNYDIPEYVKNNIKFIESFTDETVKRRFINTCDAMIHACLLGETFGLSVLEFCYCNKPVITWRYGVNRQHLRNLGNRAILYTDEKELLNIFSTFNKTQYSNVNYLELCDPFTPEKIMQQFDDVFLSKLNLRPIQI